MFHNARNRIVLEVRCQGGQAEGSSAEPWTWIRTHGKGRVFYTAWGHDHRTWSNSGFHDLVERGIRWTTQERLIAKQHRPIAKAGPKPFKYAKPKHKVPFYAPGKGRKGDGSWNKMQLPVAPSAPPERMLNR